MKKAKIMLSAITVLAIVGGALAFKAQNFVGKKYCTLTIGQPTNAKCVGFTTDVKFVDGADLRYSETSNTLNCPNITCPKEGQIAAE